MCLHVLPQEYINSLDCHNLVYRDLDCLSIPQGITLVYYIDDIMLIEPNEEKVAITLDLLIKHLCVRRWEVNPTKMREIFTLVKFLESSGVGHVEVSLLR